MRVRLETAQACANSLSMPDRGHVLFAANNEALREILADGLRELGFRVSACANGAPALDAVLSTEPPFAVLVDVPVPVVANLEILIELRRHELVDVVPVVVISSETGPAVEIDLPIFGKPVAIENLVDVLDAQIRLAERNEGDARQRLRRASRSRAAP